MEDKVNKKILQHVELCFKESSVYKEALKCNSDYSVKEYSNDKDIELFDTLDDALKNTVNSFKSELDSLFIEPYMRFTIADSYVDEYSDEQDLNKSVLYFYLQLAFMKNVEDVILKGLFEDTIKESIEILSKGANMPTIDIVKLLKVKGYATVEGGFDVNYGYLLSFIHNRFTYEEQFLALNKIQSFNNNELDTLLLEANKECGNRTTNWFIY